VPRKKGDVVAGLENKGFQAREGDHLFLHYFNRDGRKTCVYTKVSHGSKGDIDDSLLGVMAKQCRLPKKAFLLLVDCPLAREDYEASLMEREVIK
jgi:hypothetical protein